MPAPLCIVMLPDRLRGTTPADFGGRQARDEREQAERQHADTEPEAGSGATGRSAGGRTRQ